LIYPASIAGPPNATPTIAGYLVVDIRKTVPLYLVTGSS